MTREQLFNMIEYADDRLLQRSDKNTVSLEKPKKKNKLLFGMWKMQYVAAAVAIVLLTSITAVAAVTMIRRQAELRQKLGIEGKDVPDYVEFDVSTTDVTVPADAGNGDINVTVLSGMRDGQTQIWYFAVSPLSREEAEMLTWYVGSEELGGYRDASPVGWNGIYSAENPRWDVGDAYDESSQSLMLDVRFMMNEDDPHGLNPARTDPIELNIIGAVDIWDEEGYQSGIDEKFLLTAMFTPTVTDVNTRMVSLGNGIPLMNPNTGAQGRITDVEIYASGTVFMRYTIPEDAETMNRYYNEGAAMPNEEYLDLQDNVFVPWSNAADALMLDMTINFKDGTSTGGYVSGRLTYKNGVLEAEGMSDKPIVLDEIESVTIGGQRFLVQ
ncbi:MAG: hypothetical protein IJQ21_09900 [Lachnospiraceae bacterium]|nr:hypothetical protein [Lachnospiraceae bacterium]